MCKKIFLVLFTLFVSSVCYGEGDSELLLLTDSLRKLTLSAWEASLEKFNLNKQVPRNLMRGPKEFIAPDPAKVDIALEKIHELIWGTQGWDEKKERAFMIPPKEHTSSQELRKQFLSDIDGHDMTFLSERFGECRCEDLGRQVGFISVRDLAEKKVADMILDELKSSKFVRYVSVASGGYYFDYRVLRRVCVAWQELKIGKAGLEIFLVDPGAPYINELEAFLKQSQYSCNNIDLKLHTAAIPFEELPKDLCPTIIAGIDIGFDYKKSIMRIRARCGDKIKGLLFVHAGVTTDEKSCIQFSTAVTKEDKNRIAALVKDGYVDMGFEVYDVNKVENLGYVSTLDVETTAKVALFIKSIPLSEEGIKLFKQELKSAGLID